MPTFREDLHLGHEVALWETDDIRDRAITSQKIALKAIITELIADLAVTTEKLADLSVTTPKIAELAVVTSKLAELAVTTEKVAEQAITTEKINDLAVVTEKIAELAVTTGKIADLAVTEGKMADDSVSTRTIIDKNVTREKIADKAVDTPQIEDGAVTHEKMHENSVGSDQIIDSNVGWQKLNDDLQNIIASAGQHGIALSNEWGNSTLIGLTQKMLSEALGNVHKDGNNFISLQQQIDQIVNDKATVSLSVTPSPVFVGVQSNISLVATTNTQATSIKIKKGSIEIAAGSGLTLNGSDTIMPSAAGNTTYLAEFTIAGLLKQTTKNVVAVYPILYGAGDEYTDAQTQASVRTTPAGTYNVVVPENEDYVFFVVPRNMNINSAKMSGFDFPLQAPVNVEIDGVEYKYYQSANTYDAGTLTIVIS